MQRDRYSITIKRLVLISCLLFASSTLVFGADSSVKVHRFHPKIEPGMATPVPARRPSGFGISDHALSQINALLLDKQSRTPEQRKISSRLLYTVRMLRDEPVASGVPSLETGVELDDNGDLYVNIIADVSDDLLSRLRNAGVRIINSFARYHSILALVPFRRLEEIAGWKTVHFIRPKPDAFTNDVISEGDATHEADLGRDTFGVDGTGVKVGVLSDDVTALAVSQSLGELGPVTVLPGQTGTCRDNAQSCNEGTAMLEIIHDLAPGASLYFATGMTDMASMAKNILDLRAAGCDIIVDDVTYFAETPFQDGQTRYSDTNGGIITQAVNEVVSDGAMYFSSAANSGNIDSSSAGTYEHDFVDSDGWHVFDQSSANIVDQITSGSDRPITLQWSDPLGASSDDYDLFVLDPTASFLVAVSDDVQSGTQDPFEEVPGYANATNNLIAIYRYSGESRFLHLATHRGTLRYSTSGAITGHHGARNAFSVAATPAYLSFSQNSPSGPYPAPFNSGNVTELFSSDGPRRIFFRADGTPITPGNYLSSGGELLQKPDLTAADGVSVSGVGNFETPFYGTSAAAPHAAAIAALVKSAQPGVSNAAVRNALLYSAIDIMSPGWDRDSGNGIVMAYDALSSILTQPPTGITNIGVFRDGSWYLDANGSGLWDAGDMSVDFGLATDTPVEGDWNGDGFTEIGVKRGTDWYLDYNGNGLWDGCAIDRCYSFGLSSDIPVVGDWNGSGSDKIGVFRNGIWYLDADGNGVWNGTTDKEYWYGMSGDIPVTGDWNGDGVTEIGAFRAGNWYMDYTGDGSWSGCGTTGSTDRCYYFGMGGDMPVTGDWSGDGITKIGVKRGPYWYLDYTGDGNWSGCGTILSSDRCYNFGLASDIPLAGSW